MCYVGRLKGSGSQKCSKDRANTRVDLRNAANSLQIEGKGVQPGDPYHWGGWGVGTRNTRPYIHSLHHVALTLGSILGSSMWIHMVTHS